MNDDLSNYSMLELFRVEAEHQTGVLMNGLLEVERGQSPPPLLESLMRAAHSIKGAARIINLPAAVSVAHAMEDCFVAAQKGKLTLTQPEIDVLLHGVDLLSRIAKGSEAEMAGWETERAGQIEQEVAALRRLLNPSSGVDRPTVTPVTGSAEQLAAEGAHAKPAPASQPASSLVPDQTDVPEASL